MTKIFRFTQRRTAPTQTPVASEAGTVPSQQPTTDESSKALTFAEIAQRNAENQERLKRERAKANKNVLRSYRIK